MASVTVIERLDTTFFPFVVRRIYHVHGRPSSGKRGGGGAAAAAAAIPVWLR